MNTIPAMVPTFASQTGGTESYTRVRAGDTSNGVSVCILFSLALGPTPKRSMSCKADFSLNLVYIWCRLCKTSQ